VRLIYLIGTPRGGTTWLQNMLGAYPAVATPQELGLFIKYVAPWHERWQLQLERGRLDRHMGLPAAISEGVFAEIVTDAVLRVYEEVLALKPGATVVLEKAPAYTRYASLIHRYFPEARFVHIIRDGRDVAASLLRAAGGWGHGWATSSIERAAWIWRVQVETGRRVRNLTSNYLEVRYEDLRSEGGPAILAEVLDYCGLEADEETAATIYETFRLQPEGPEPPSSIVWGGEVFRRHGRPSEPPGFFGEGRAGWRSRLSRFEQYVFDDVAGDLLAELGYAEPGWPEIGAARRAAFRARLAAGRLAIRTRFAAGAARRVFRERGLPPEIPGPFAPPREPAAHFPLLDEAFVP
jgi:hypothetical protein